MDPDFREQVATALKTASGAKARFVPQDVVGLACNGYLIESHLVLLSADEFADKFNKHPKEVGLSEIKLEDQSGQSFSGILLQDPSHPYKSVRVFHGVQTQLSETIHRSAQQLRPNEGGDMHKWHTQQVQKNLPKQIKQLDRAMTMEEMATWVKRRARAAEQASLAAAAAPQAPIQQSQPVAPLAPLQGLFGTEDAEHEGDAEADDNDILPQVGAVATRGAAAKALPKAKAKSCRITGKKPLLANASTRPLQSDSMPVAAGGGLPESPRSRAQEPAAKRRKSTTGSVKAASISGRSEATALSKSPEDGARKWIDLLDVNMALQGKNMGQEKYQASRQLKRFVKEDEYCVEAVGLQNKLNMVQIAEDLYCGCSKLSKSKKREYIVKLNEMDVVWPPVMQSSLIAFAAKDVMQALISAAKARLSLPLQ